eukprot:792639-Rhodomonas_salina.1
MKCSVLSSRNVVPGVQYDPADLDGSRGAPGELPRVRRMLQYDHTTCAQDNAEDTACRIVPRVRRMLQSVSYTHLRAHETEADL